mmetsp:Transcript_13900/g.24366  ORF Transcript_13900/g.24366 Transcript_13900/m.24366 type:complete len:95 (+) Transcript_13900:2238-2522(+)
MEFMDELDRARLECILLWLLPQSTGLFPQTAGPQAAGPQGSELDRLIVSEKPACRCRWAGPSEGDVPTPVHTSCLCISEQVGESRCGSESAAGM